MERTSLIAGNWKMNGRLPDALAEVRSLLQRVEAAAGEGPELLLCPPAILLPPMRAELERHGANSRDPEKPAGGPPLFLGGQDCHPAQAGAHTGDISAEMLRDAGASHVLVGHSERRLDHGERGPLIAAKVAAAHRAGLVAILCVGETLKQRETGQAPAVVSRQVRAALSADCVPANLVIAYEPVWAIGTGLTPTVEDVAVMHATIRRSVERITGQPGHRILYGGSVKPGNAAELLAIDGVDGALVGGASLSAADFWSIAMAARAR